MKEKKPAFTKHHHQPYKQTNSPKVTSECSAQRAVTNYCCFFSSSATRRGLLCFAFSINATFLIISLTVVATTRDNDDAVRCGGIEEMFGTTQTQRSPVQGTRHCFQQFLLCIAVSFFANASAVVVSPPIPELIHKSSILRIRS